MPLPLGFVPPCLPSKALKSENPLCAAVKREAEGNGGSSGGDENLARLVNGLAGEAEFGGMPMPFKPRLAPETT